jgi:hypothetical protein
MRRRLAVAVAVLIAAFALAGLPAPTGSTSPSAPRDVQPAAFTALTVSASAREPGAADVPDAGLRSDGYLSAAARFLEPGKALKVPRSRPRVAQPATSSAQEWKPPRYTVSGNATFYGNGTTAMRLPRGTIVRICGKGGCIERTVDDYGPQSSTRIVDLYKPDFFSVCGCPSWSGTTWVTISVY